MKKLRFLININLVKQRVTTFHQINGQTLNIVGNSDQ